MKRDTSSQPPVDPLQPALQQIVAEARIQRQAAAEARARHGTFEILTDSDGNETSCTWSPGIYAMLGRQLADGPLAREIYVQTYVHHDDQQRLKSATRDILKGNACSGLYYRVQPHTGPMLNVIERLSLAAMHLNGQVYFGDLQEVVDRHAPVPATSLIPAALRSLCSDPASTPGSSAIIALFDALKDGEHRRLTREMHDDFGQLLAAMKLDLSLLQRELPPQCGKAQQQVDNLQELVNSMIVSVRRIIADLPPKAVEDLGLFAALEQLVQSFRKRHPMRFVLRFEGPELLLRQGLDLAIYRIVQEALTNILRHAKAGLVSIHTDHDDQRFRLQIQDDGQGTTAADLRKSGSYGTAWMRERVTALGGTMTIGSEPGKGTLIDIAIPISMPLATSANQEWRS